MLLPGTLPDCLLPAFYRGGDFGHDGGRDDIHQRDVPGETAWSLPGLDHDDRGLRYSGHGLRCPAGDSLRVWGWRLVFVWGSLGMLILLFVPRLEESPRWYENQGRLAEADAALERIEARVRAESGELPAAAELATPTVQRAKYSELFTPSVRGRTALLVSVWFFEALGFYGAQAWIPTLLVAKGFSLVHSLTWTSAMQLGAPVGAMLAGVISDRWDRKWLITVCVLLKAACAVVYGLSGSMASIVVFGCLMMISFQMFTPILYAYTAECFPTHVRNSGAGISYGAGRGANSFGPLIVAFLFSHYGYMSVFVYIAGMFVAVALIVGAFGPRTKGRVLS